MLRPEFSSVWCRSVKPILAVSTRVFISNCPDFCWKFGRGGNGSGRLWKVLFCSFDRWLCALLGMIIVGISILCVSKRPSLTGGLERKLSLWARITRKHFRAEWSLLSVFYFYFYVFCFEGKSAPKQGEGWREREEERERIPSRLHTASTEPDVELEPPGRSWPEPKCRAGRVTDWATRAPRYLVLLHFQFSSNFLSS